MHGLIKENGLLLVMIYTKTPSILNEALSRNLNFSGRLDLKKALIIIEGKGDDEQKQIIAPLYPTDKKELPIPALVLVSIKGRALE